MIIPLSLLVIAISIILFWIVSTGLPVELGMAFVGGTEVRLDVSGFDDPQSELDSIFESQQDGISSVPGTNEYIVTFPSETISPEEVESIVNENSELSLNEISQISPLLGTSAQQTALMGLLISFLLMSTFVFILFKSIAPSLIVILSAVGNISVAVAAMNVVGIPLTMGTVGAILMLIGYSIDSDILMNNYVLNETKVSFNESIHEAMRTGITMSVTSLSAMIMMTIVATIFSIELLAHMGFVLSVGLATDMIITYMMNVGILRYYMRKKGDYV